MKHMVIKFGVVLWLAALSSASSQAAEDYAIRLMSPEKVGNKYQVYGKLTEISEQKLMLEGKVVQEQKTKEDWDFDGKVEVLEVAGPEVTSKVSIVVKKMTVTIDGTTTEAYPPGTVITGKMKGDRTFYVKEQQVTPEANKALKEFIPMDDSEEPVNDAIFGTKKRVKVGDVWPVNAEAAQRILSDEEMKVDASQITGESKLEELATVEGQKCLKVSCHAVLKKVSPAFPPEMKLQKGEIEIKVTGFYTVKDNRQMAGSLDYKMEFNAGGKMPDGKVMELQAKGHTKGEKKFKYE